MRRLAMASLVAGTLALLGSAAAAQGDRPDEAGRPGPVHVIEVDGLVDPVLVDVVTRSIDVAAGAGAEALVLQLDSPGVVVDGATLEALQRRLTNAPVPVGAWIGPSGATAAGGAERLAAATGVTGISPGSTIEVDGERLGARAALARGVVDVDAPTIGDFIVQLDGREVGGRTLRTAEVVATDDGPRRQPLQVSFAKPGLLEQLMHTVASPPVAYLLLAAGLALLLFELYTAGVGIAGVVGAGSLVLAAYGLAVLPVSTVAVVLLVASTVAFAIDVQAGISRFWTAAGAAGWVVGSVLLFTGVPRPWLALAVGTAGMLLMMLSGMPSMVRTRFATPTIGRESMIGELGDATVPVRPDGVVRVRGALWRARTNRATPIDAGARVRVVGIDGLLLEVEPEEGGAKDYRR